MIGPLKMWDDSKKPAFIRWETTPKPEALLVGLGATLEVPSPSRAALNGGATSELASPAGVVPEWSRQIPGEVPAAGGSGKAA